MLTHVLLAVLCQKVKEVRNIVTGSVKSAFSISVDNTAQAQDLTSALADVKSHYEALAQRSKQDALLSVQDSVRGREGGGGGGRGREGRREGGKGRDGGMNGGMA